MAHKARSSHFLYKSFLWITLIPLLLSAGGCQLWQNRQAPTPGGQEIPLDSHTSTENGGGTTMQAEPTSIPVQLSEGQSQLQTIEPVPQATGVPLSDEEIDQVLIRLPELTGEPQDQVDFNLAVEPIPPPKTGETISEAFPPPAQEPIQPAGSEAGPLEVLRYAPEGEIPIAPFVNITFNQPMVPLGTLEDLAKEEVPVKLEPDLPGTWRWLGTKTLTFEYDSELIDRLPKATSYKVTIPAGIQSATGGVLAEAVTWTFSTPPPKVIATYPQDIPQPVDPLFFISFDQRIDPAAVLETVQVSAGSQPVSLELASQEEVQAHAQVKNLVKYAQEGRWLAFKAREDLPVDTPVSVTVGPGTPSAEGPLTTTEAQSYSFYTYAPLRVVDSGCAWSEAPCRPMTPFYIRFNNPLDVSAYDASLLTIQPEIPGVTVNFYGDTINIQGATQGSTTYTVVVKGDLQDVFGQKLGKDARLTFKVGHAEPMLAGPQQIFVTLDPSAGKPVFSVYTINYQKLDVQVYAVQPSDWPAFKNYLRQYQSTDNPPRLPGRLVMDETIRVEAEADALTEVDIDLSKEMDGKYGQFIIVVAPPKTLLKDYPYWQVVHAWVQVTQIGLDAFYDHSQMVAWASALQDGTPLKDVSIETDNGSLKAATGADGIAKFAIPAAASYLVAKQGADTAMLPNSAWYWDDSTWYARPVYDELRWYVFDDRQMYRPGEEVHVKGWLRRVGGEQDGDVGLVGSSVSNVSYQVLDPQGNDLGGGQAEVNALGGFDFSFTLPQEVNLGYAQLILNAQGSLEGFSSYQYYHGFQVQEFRRPEFEVIARNETPGPYFAGGSATVAVEASYYAGGPLPGADVTWLVTTSPASYSPPNWPDFTFGTWTPWWYYGRFDEGAYFDSYGNGGQSETFTGKTDSSGMHYLDLAFNQDTGPQPLSVLAEATVMDLNRQAWADTTTLLVHPADLYVGLRSQLYFVDLGTPLEIDFIVTDLDGNPVVDRPVEVTASRLEWKYSGSGWSQEEVDTQTCKLGSKEEPLTCTFQTPVGGTYQITATVTDALGRKNQSQFTRWVSGGKQPPARQVEQEQASLIPDKETYQPGDTARILVQSPFSPAEGLLTVSRSGILYTQRFEIEDGTATLTVPIEEKYIPNLNIQVDLVGSAPRLDDQGKELPAAPPRPAFATGQLNLKIPPVQRTLSLQVEPDRSELEPGGETTLNLTLKDASGQPVSGAELAVVVVDEAILALSNYQLADPLGVFYLDRPADLSSLYSRSAIILANPQEMTEEVSRQAADMVLEKEMVMEAPAMAAMPTMTASAEMKGANEGAASSPIAVRSDFNPLALFSPAVRTNTDGTASVPVKLPDNLTRYRVMVVAVDDSGRQFGMGESNLVARLPLMVRPSAPRFLNFGDAFELPVLLQNQTGEPLEVEVVVQGSNIHLLDLNAADGSFTDQSGLRITVPARDRVEVRFPAQTDMAGTARFQIAAVSGAYADAVTIELPVYTPATTEAFATYGVVDEGTVFQPVQSPSDVFPQYGGLEVTTSSTALQALTDAVLYLVSYPFECTEQIASRLLGIAALRDVLTAFEADGLPSPEAMEASVQSDIERLRSLQNNDGGYPYWRHGQDSIPFNTIHVAHALQRARLKGFDVPEDMQQRVLDYLRQIESYYPYWYGQNTRWTLSAYALYVRDLMGDSDPDKALKLYDEAGIEKLSLDAIGWLWQVLSDVPSAASQVQEIRRYVNNHAVETPGAANFTTTYDDENYLLLSSDRRTDAILLDAMLNDNPEYDLIPKLVNGLLAHSTNGRWANTQENVFVLVALDRYFNTFEAQEPDFVARIWLGETYAGDHTYQGYSTDTHETQVPMAYLVDPALGGGGTQDLILSKDGAGRLYYRLGMKYAPTDLQLDPLDMGFVVMRTYNAVDDPADVSQDEDGFWHIRAGARVRVVLTMVAQNRRYHVALADPLPAGLEIVNPSLEVSGSTPQDPNSSNFRYGWWWWGTWYEHQNLRDERAEAFTSLLWDGVYEYSYVARATTPGTFVVPPAKAEEMYSPEVFGRSASDVVIVK